MKRHLLSTFPAMALALTVMTPAQAAPAADTDPIATWVKTVNLQLDRAMVDPDNDASGVVRISFRRDANGRPSDVVVHSRNPDLLNAARRTIARIGALPPLPDGYTASQVIGMQLLFADNDVDAYEKQRSAILANADRQNRQVALNKAMTEVAIARTQN